MLQEHRPYGLEANIKVAHMGGNAAKVARDDIEENLGETVITRKNALNYKYLDDNKLKQNQKKLEKVQNIIWRRILNGKNNMEENDE